MAKIDAANTLMFGSESDAIYLSEYTKDLLNSVTALDSAVPTAMEDMGWISEDGLSINLNDSSDKIKGHQGHGTVRLYMSDSTTQLEVSLLEAKAKTLGWNFDATVEKIQGQGGKSDYAKVVAPSARAAGGRVRHGELHDPVADPVPPADSGRARGNRHEGRRADCVQVHA